MISLRESPVQNIIFQGQSFLLKRDELVHKDFSGNKARKFLYFLENEFLNVKKLISHGSNQSNAMYSLSVLCKLKNWNFEYYTNHLPSYLKDHPQGNYKYSLENGMNLIVKDDFTKDSCKFDETVLFIEEGGALMEASYGIKILASEISVYQKQHNLNNLKIFLPSGTGTTALFLQKFLDIEVQTCACVGDEEYLKKQFLALEKNEQYHPTILSRKKKYHFGKLYKENYMLWNQLKMETKIEFDLLYDPIGWDTLLYNFDENNTYMYIHQGGLIGNESMIQRYKYKYNSF